MPASVPNAHATIFSGHYVSSLLYSDQILSIDQEYVEARSDLSTTKRALGKWAEAEERWWRAIRLRPG
ncbi:uncharacterized protein MELLADRAFT_90977 [Melampsora larici-populina 98AG31]|uniref:Uncharacterized protein n=1 Tax=Melampsora larici-populina (strain 98AG31 / pathotype 3-4-7) TaxID=747676 RepID=F4R885_MELLP|nr:uncharacterized protein MELLADRAFT_90977 [Melampsora larici-populina 98AG31]EGG11658.1 hypothetical protein MELLADRAFT_90977 [Melampsora larici-populina 98AG31]